MDKGLVVPDGKGGFKEENSMPACCLCTKDFQQGDTLTDVVMAVAPGKMSVAPGHLACALAVMQARIREQQAKAASAGQPEPGPGESYAELHSEVDKGSCEEHGDTCPQGAHPKELVLIREEGVPQGYFLEHLEHNMDEVTLRRWRVWYRGQTGAIVGGNMLVYKHDYDRFVRNEGRPDTLPEWD